MMNDKKQVRLVMRQGEHEGKRYPVKKDSILLGSDSSCDIVIKGNFVSPKHAVISRRDDGLWMISNQSVNRTLVNQQVVETQQLVSGDMIQVGAESLLEFEVVKKKSQKEKKAQQEKNKKNEKPLTRRPLVQFAVVFYLLLLIVVGIVFKGLSSPDTDSSLSPDQVEEVLHESRLYLSSEKFAQTTNDPQMSGSNWDIEAAATYYQLVSSAKSNDPSQKADVDPLLEELLTQSRSYLFTAWKFERQMRWLEAVEEYQKVLSIIPDIRVPLARFVTHRISLLNEKIEQG